jgi:hypothetical protein
LSDKSKNSTSGNSSSKTSSGNSGENKSNTNVAMSNITTLTNSDKTQGLKNRAKNLIDLIHSTVLDSKYGGDWRSAARNNFYGSIYNNEDVISMAFKALNNSKAGSGYGYDLEKAK